MKRALKFLFWYCIYVIAGIFMIWLISGCVPYRYLDKHHSEICNKCIDEYAKDYPKKDSISIIVDTIKVESHNQTNNMYQQLYFECDSLGEVRLISISEAIDSLSNAKGRLAAINRIVSNYAFLNGVLTVSDKVYQDSITLLNKQITILESNVKVITSPPITVYKTPFWVWFVLVLCILCISGMIFVILKK
jgi:hypothetical protein